MGGAVSGSKKAGPIYNWSWLQLKHQNHNSFLSYGLSSALYMCSFYCSLIFAPEVYPNRFSWSFHSAPVPSESFEGVEPARQDVKGKLVSTQKTAASDWFRAYNIQANSGWFPGFGWHPVLPRISWSVLFPRIPCPLPLLHATLETR